ncbi:hypothetical protein [Parasitella parasitica]|uniref:Uncharacterized protein n=1 Tax=Parasitella parasitica TaxID=35722 RepID=A0A0B7MQ44_9FUNG|nr:hypothetical protein [Parasitella parasitica]
MTHLQVATTVPLYDTFTCSSCLDQGLDTKYATDLLNSTAQYRAEDDCIALATSTTSSWDSSQRSSYSSILSATCINSPAEHNRQIKHYKSLPPPNGDKYTLYPTKETAYKRIEWMEEQMKLSRHSNEAIVQRMSQSIQMFLDTRRNTDDLEQPSSKDSGTDDKKLMESSKYSSQHHVVGLVLEKLAELKAVVDKHTTSLTLDHMQVAAEKTGSQVIFSTQMIDKWIDRVTEHKNSPKQDLKNVEAASAKEKRLIEGLKRLSRQKKAAHHEAAQTAKARISSLQTAFENQKKQLRQHLQAKLNDNKQEQKDMEQVVDDMRHEMELMIEELNQSKQKREHLEQRSKRIQDDLKALQSPNTKNPDILALQSLLRESEAQIDHLKTENEGKTGILKQTQQDFAQEILQTHAAHAHEIKALKSEKEDLYARLAKAEKSAATHSSELEEALRRTVAERDGELAKTRFELEKSKRHSVQLQKLNEKQMQLELDARFNELKSSLKSQYRKDVDTCQLRLTREIRNMSGQIVELETELQDLERQHLRDIKSIQHYEPKLATLEKELMVRIDKEALLKSALMDSNQKVSVLEKEALFLYSKNLELAQHLSGLDS